MKFDENLRVLKQHDNDKYLALLSVKPDKMRQLAALFNFHYQISQIPLEVTEPMVGMIKIQWWRDVLEEVRTGKPPRPHPILLGLQHSNVNYTHLELVLNYYEKLLDGWQPRSFEELEDFVENTQVAIFEEAANILEQTFSINIVRAYSYNYLARKLAVNPDTYNKFFGKPADIGQKLLAKSRELNSSGTVFGKITRYYNSNLTASRWRLLLQLAFSRMKIF